MGKAELRKNKILWLYIYINKSINGLVVLRKQLDRFKKTVRVFPKTIRSFWLLSLL